MFAEHLSSNPDFFLLLFFLLHMKAEIRSMGGQYVSQSAGHVIFSSPELKAQVSFSDRLLSIVCLSVRLTSVC
jgi:hypothetical protein